ncbi:MAG TPA: thioredoxin domain-containing protein [Sphingomicrobium sp.]|nr:thioredoxin domain-containing protein [Sphingomicrobium sp.]
MKPTTILLATTAALATIACNAENGAENGAKNGGSAAGGNAAPVEAVAPPENGDWTEVVTQTPKGSFRMGNPDADVALVEFGSMTCPACANFDENGVPQLIDDYVKTGRVSFEFRNYVRDPFDITAALIARCNGAQGFFPLTRALFKGQREWIEKIQSAPEAQLLAVQNMGPERQFLEIARLADFQKWAAMRGVPTAKSSQCLTDREEINQLVQMNADATTEYPRLPGTPSFAINGKLLEQASTWETLEPKIREALGN